MRLLIKKIDDDGRLGLVPQFLDTDWDIEVVDTDDLAAFDRALAHADAMVSMDRLWQAIHPDDRVAVRSALTQAFQSRFFTASMLQAPPSTPHSELSRRNLSNM